MKFKKKIGHLTFNKMDFRVKCSCPLHQLFSCYQKYFGGFISVLKKRMLSFDLSVLVYPPDTSVPDAIACLSLSMVCQ